MTPLGERDCITYLKSHTNMKVRRKCGQGTRKSDTAWTNGKGGGSGYPGCQEFISRSYYTRSPRDLTKDISVATVKKMEDRVHLSNYGDGKHLWTRELGREILSDAEDSLSSLAVGDVLVIDAKGIEVFDYSFANELFGKVLLRLPVEYSGRFVVVENLNSYTRENLEKGLESLGLVIIERRKARISLLGKLHPTEEVTFEATRKGRKPVSAAKLAEKLGVGVTAMNERLTKLVDRGLLRREKSQSSAGREQYVYSVLQ